MMRNKQQYFMIQPWKVTFPLLSFTNIYLLPGIECCEERPLAADEEVRICILHDEVTTDISFPNAFILVFLL